MDKEFNLLYEPWIPVLDGEGVVCEVSLLDALERAHEYTRLAGELATQDVAVLRLLLAALYSTFTRADITGSPTPLTDENALERWCQFWEKGRFPIDPIKTRLCFYDDASKGGERFYLFHPETPFYQVAGLNVGSEFTAAKLMGDVSESGNKPRLFAIRSGEAKQSLSFSEAARWLLYLNAFDDTSAKPTRGGDKKISTGAGYLGKLGLVYASGGNLFETLMLNLVMRKQGKGQTAWEVETCATERCEIPIPDSDLQLLTLQSRRILLKRESNRVSGFILLGGDVFNTENAFIENMTIWRKDKESKTDIYKPKRHNPAKSLWRDFAALTVKGNGAKRPGLVDWIARLQREKKLKRGLVSFQTASVKFGDKDFFVDDVFGDSVTVNADILTEIGADWVTRICDNLQTTEKCVFALTVFGGEVEIAVGWHASGDKDTPRNKSSVQRAAAQAYFDLDEPFRCWLAEIDPNTDDMDKKSAEWFAVIRSLLLAQGREILTGAGERALTGKNNAASAYQKFVNTINKLTNYNLNEKGE